MWVMAGTSETDMSHLPEEVLMKLFAAVSDTRTRNSLSLVCQSFLHLERKTRTSLTLRGNARDLHLIPTSFRHVTHLDLSFLFPWCYSLFSTASDPPLFALRLRHAFPHVTSLALYSSTPITLHLLLLSWPELRRIKLVRWHEPPHPGSDFAGLFEHCRSLTSLDLSTFHYWSTTDLLSGLTSNPVTAQSLRRLNFRGCFDSIEIQLMTRACPNLEHLLLVCTFNPTIPGYVGDDTLLAIASNCPRLSLLHLGINKLPWVTGRGVDAEISRGTMVEFFSGLPLLEELVLGVDVNVRVNCFALEVLDSKCPKLRVLHLGHFQWNCLAIGSELQGIALCQGLQSLSISNCADLTDKGLVKVARGCSRLVKFHVQGCKSITEKGLKTLTCLLRRTLIDVKISHCLNFDTSASLRALEPIRDRVECLHVDCVWSGFKESDNMGRGFNLEEPCSSDLNDDEFIEQTSQTYESGHWCNGSWDRLRYLSLCIGVCDLLTALPMAGLEDCPNLEEIRIRVEGGCLGELEPPESGFGLSTLACYPKLSKMQLCCGGTTLDAPLSQWERFFLSGIGTLNLYELHYWPPLDQDLFQKIISVTAAGLLQECNTLRKLFIHGTAHEQFMQIILQIPHLRDIQLMEDYYTAPDRSGMRVSSCSIIEDALNRRRIRD